MNFFALTTYSQEQLEKLFGTTLTYGLTQSEVARRQKQQGLNALSKSRFRAFPIFIRQFKSPIVYILFLSALLSGILESDVDATLILIIVIINACLGFIREYQTEHIATLLQHHLSVSATVMRAGKELIIDSSKLVVGDSILLKAGDLVPADIRIIEASDLIVNESLLTGESAPVIKKSSALAVAATTVYGAQNMAFLGTAIIAGSARGIVVATGKQSMFGSIGDLSAQTQRMSGFQIKLNRLSSFLIRILLGALVSLMVAHVIIVGLQGNFFELLLFAVVLALSLIPEALPVITTLCLSRGAMRLLQEHMVVKRLSAVEDLGSMTLLCTDKTGTLTENKLSVAATKNLSPEYNPVFFSSLASGSDDLFKEALFVSLTTKELESIKKAAQKAFVPFSSELRRTINVVTYEGQNILISRGAPESIFELCNLTAQEHSAYQAFLEEQGKLGRRVIGVAVKNLESVPTNNLTGYEKEMTCVGLIAFEDPIKDTAAAAIERIKKMGVAIKMITGDSKEVACYVAQQVGLIAEPEGTEDAQCAITGAEFAALSPAQQKVAVRHYTVFARILPQQKYTIIEALREENIVGFMGEGINDTPALKIAHVGIVVQHGSDVAKDAADIIILRKSLTLVGQGIAVGRTVFINTLKYITITLSANIGNFISVAIASLSLNFLPLLPLQILLINLLSDLPMVALAGDTYDPIDSHHPSTYNLTDIAKSALIFGAVASCFDIFFFGMFYKQPPELLRTNWFIENIITELLLVFSLRTQLPFYKAARPSHALIALSVLAAGIAVALPLLTFGKSYFHFVSPSMHDLVKILLLSFACFGATELTKLFFYRKSKLGMLK